MQVIYWNCRGFGNPRTRLMLRNFCVSNKPDFVFLSEPWISISDVLISFWRQLNLKVFILNDRGSHLPNIWGLCNSLLDPSILSNSSQQCSFSINVDGSSLFISAIYASTSYLLRRSLWNELIHLQLNNPGAWCMIGDFNIVLGAHRSSSLPLRIACDDFKNFTDIGNLIHLPTRV